MKVELFCIADYAADQAGKLTIVGIFDSLNAPQFPVAHPSCSLAVKLRFETIEAGTKRLRLNLTDADGKLVLPSIDLPIEVQMQEGQHTCTRQLVANIGGLKIEKPGEYSFDLAIGFSNWIYLFLTGNFFPFYDKVKFAEVTFLTGRFCFFL